MSRSKRAGRPRKPPPVTIPGPSSRWDMGATGAANQAGLVQEDAGDVDLATGRIVNPNGVRRMRRVDMLEVWQRKGTISTRGLHAAQLLRGAYERTQCGPGWPDNDRVQSSPRPDLAVTIQIDALSAYHAVARLVDVDDRPVIEACVLRGGTPGRCGYRGRTYSAGLVHLAEALDRLAGRLGW